MNCKEISSSGKKIKYICLCRILYIKKNMIDVYGEMTNP